MAEVTVEGDRLVVRITGLNKLWALKSRLRIPLDHVRGATADSGIAKEHKGIRAPVRTFRASSPPERITATANGCSGTYGIRRGSS